MQVHGPGRPVRCCVVHGSATSAEKKCQDDKETRDETARASEGRPLAGQRVEGAVAGKDGNVVELVHRFTLLLLGPGLRHSKTRINAEEQIVALGMVCKMRELDLRTLDEKGGMHGLRLPNLFSKPCRFPGSLRNTAPLAARSRGSKRGSKATRALAGGGDQRRGFFFPCGGVVFGGTVLSMTSGLTRQERNHIGNCSLMFTL